MERPALEVADIFRNHGPAGSRWWKVQELCEGKTVFLLTATPINNSLLDFAHEAELITGMQEKQAKAHHTTVSGHDRAAGVLACIFPPLGLAKIDKQINHG